MIVRYCVEPARGGGVKFLLNAGFKNVHFPLSKCIIFRLQCNYSSVSEDVCDFVFVGLAKLFILTLIFSLQTMPGGSWRTVGPLCADRGPESTQYGWQRCTHANNAGTEGSFGLGVIFLDLTQCGGLSLGSGARQTRDLSLNYSTRPQPILNKPYSRAMSHIKEIVYPAFYGYGDIPEVINLLRKKRLMVLTLNYFFLSL